MWLHFTEGASRAGRRSITTTSTPASANHIANVSPTGPPPTMATSVSIVDNADPVVAAVLPTRAAPEGSVRVMTDIGEAAELWRTRGWVLIPELVPSADIDRAVEQLWDLYPTPEQFHAEEATQEEFGAKKYAGFNFPDDDDEGAAFRAKQFLGHTMFPYASPLLNRLNVHANVADFAKRAIGHDQLRIYQARIWGKYTGVVNYEQPFHQDRNHNVVPDRLEEGWWNLEGFLYLTDVDEDVAPTSVLGTGATPPDAEPISAAGPRGSYLAYRPDVWLSLIHI